jgi:hypothetical protein
MKQLRFASLLGALYLIFGIVPAAWADSMQVTFTGNIYWTFSQEWGGPSFHGILKTNSFSAILTYDPAQPDLNALPNQGMYGNYGLTITVQTFVDPVTFDGDHPLCVNDDFADEFGTVASVGNGGSFAAFTFWDYSHSALSGDSLADVNWQNLLTLSSLPHSFVRAPNGAVVAGGSVHDMFLRADNAAVVVMGRIEAVSVQTIPSPAIPEPSTLALLGIGLVGIIAAKYRK